MKRARTEWRGLRHHLSAREAEQHRGAIDAAVEAHARAWHVVGWAFVGRDPLLSVELRRGVHAHQPLRKPSIPLPPPLSGRLALRVVASRPQARPQELVTFLEPLAPVVEPLAPGAPIVVGTAGSAGIAALLRLDDRVHLLTCGHAFEGDTDVFLPRGERPVATLSRSYLDGPDPLDAAVCELTDEGLARLDDSRGAPTWLSGFHAPGPADNQATAVFWPTGDGGGPFEASISSFAAQSSVLFRDGPSDGFIELSFGAVPGDSGSLLSLDDAYYGLCSGQVENSWSYFTPIATVLERLGRDYRQVALWHPGDDGLSRRS